MTNLQTFAESQFVNKDRLLDFRSVSLMLLLLIVVADVFAGVVSCDLGQVR